MMRYFQSVALNFLPVSWLRHRLQARTCKPDLSKQKKLIVDVSSIAQSDAKTGIQRVVRNLYQQLLLAPPAGYVVCPVVATRKQFYQYVSQDFLQQASPALRDSSTPIYIEPGDIFLGLDLSAHLIPHHLPAMWAWKKQGLRMSFVIYDLLSVLSPEWFNLNTPKNFHRWLRAVALFADSVIAISLTVQKDFHAWMQQHYQLSSTDIPCPTIPLGADMDGYTIIAPAQLPRQLVQRNFVLMIGTIEPRKSYDDALDAFEKLWSIGNQTQLVIVGKQGWKVKTLTQRLQMHSESGKRLIWLNQVDDSLLHTLYQHCDGVFMASKGEGFGLPLVEAAYFCKPVLARDIPIFREIAVGNVTFFSDNANDHLFEVLNKWIGSLVNAAPSIGTERKNFVNWQESNCQLVRLLAPAACE